MKHRLIAFALCLVMLVITCVGCGVTYSEDNTIESVAFVYAPGGKLIVYGNLTYVNIFQNGRIVVEIDGITYTTHISNVVIAEKDLS